jgi:LuxR family maltose regulon positive regulatory protein
MQSSDELPVSQIKIRIPFRRRELISRTRLTDALYDQLEKRLLLIVAPAGYGKTSLLVDLAQQSELPICWLSLDVLDQEPQRFLRYMIAAIAERFPDFGRDSLAALESIASLDKDEERLLVTISNEINTLINEHFLLILDDYHLVGDIPFIGHVVSRFLQLTGENVHLILTSRNLPDLPDSPLLIAHNQVGGLAFDELSFLPEEIQQLFQQNNDLAMSRQDAQTLVEQTEGWIAAIHLTNGQPGVLPRMHPLESTRELFDFFSKEVLLRQTEQVQRFLLMTSLFEAFDVTLCEKVLEPLVEGERFDWLVLFNSVRTRNLFSVLLDNEGRWMRYHHLFQHYLRSQLQYEHPVLAWHIQQNLARAYEEQQAWEEALQVYAGLEDYDNQVRLLMQAGAIFILSGRILTLANWLEKLPDDVVYSQPVLVSLLGIVHTTRGDNHRALELYNLAESKLREKGNEVDWTATLVRRAEVYRQLGLYDRALEDVDKILELTNESPILGMQFTFAEAQRIKGLALFGLGHMKEALNWLQKALQTCRTLGIKKNIPILETELGVVHRRLGEPEITARYYASALKAWENAGNTGWKARLLNNMGLLHHLTGRLEEAFSFLEDARTTAERSGYVQIQTNVLISLGDLLTDFSDLESAYEHYDKALTLATNLGNSLYIFYASLGQARLKRMSGESLLAVEELKQAEISQVRIGIFERALFNLELGCCWLDASKLEPAVIALREAVALFGEGGNQMEQLVARLWLEIASSFQYPDTAIAKLKDVMPPQREWQVPGPLMINAGRAGLWLKKRGNSQLFKDAFLKKCFEHATQTLASLPILYQKLRQPPDHPQSNIPRLEIISFGNVQVNHNQRVVGVSDWQTREARDLFFFLLHSPPLTKEQIALEFWPDISPARLKMRFKINIYRIRKAIGQDVVIFENERYRFNRTIRYSWDREKFDELLQVLPYKEGSEKLRTLEQATEMIKGAYLADLDAEWAVSDRLRYQDHYRNLMVELAGLHLQGGQARTCLETAKLVLRSDPLLEAAHRLIIQAYASLHDRAGMTLQYRQYQQILMAELGLQPSSEINALYEQLLDAI